MSSESRLFRQQGHLPDLLEARLKEAISKCRQLTAEEVTGNAGLATIEAIVREFSIEPPFVDESGVSVTEEDTSIDVSNDFLRGDPDLGTPTFADGVRYTFAYPFSGEPFTLDAQPSTFTLSGGPPGRVDSGRRVVTHDIILFADQLAGGAEVLASRREDWVSKVRRYVESVTEDVNTHNNGLRQAVTREVEKRRRQLDERGELLRNLGIPLAARDGSSSVPLAPASDRPRRDQLRR